MLVYQRVFPKSRNCHYFTVFRLRQRLPVDVLQQLRCFQPEDWSRSRYVWLQVSNNLLEYGIYMEYITCLGRPASSGWRRVESGSITWDSAASPSQAKVPREFHAVAGNCVISAGNHTWQKVFLEDKLMVLKMMGLHAPWLYSYPSECLPCHEKMLSMLQRSMVHRQKPPGIQQFFQSLSSLFCFLSAWTLSITVTSLPKKHPKSTRHAPDLDEDEGLHHSGSPDQCKGLKGAEVIPGPNPSRCKLLYIYIYNVYSIYIYCIYTVY